VRADVRHEARQCGTAVEKARGLSCVVLETFAKRHPALFFLVGDVAHGSRCEQEVTPSS